MAIERPRATSITAKGRLIRQRRIARASTGRNNSAIMAASSRWNVACSMTPGTPARALESSTRPSRSALLAWAYSIVKP